MINFFKEFNKRQMHKAIFSYLLVTWLFVQIGLYTFPMMRLPQWSTNALIIIFIILFPYAMIKSWRNHSRN